MARWLVLNILLVPLLIATLARAQTRPPYDDEPAPVEFSIAAVANRAGSPAGTRTFAASYGTSDAQPKLLIEFDGERAKGVDSKGDDLGLDITFSKGRFRHVDGSNPGPFLEKIGAALEAKHPRLSKTKDAVVPFEIAILGTHQSRDSAGGFSNAPGDWVVAKLFLADGNAEVYFNFDPVSGDAEFSLKDEDYGDLVVEEMSKVLW